MTFEISKDGYPVAQVSDREEAIKRGKEEAEIGGVVAIFDLDTGDRIASTEPFDDNEVSLNGYVVEIQERGSDQWTRNKLTFSSEEKAEEYVTDLLGRWTADFKWRVTKV